MSHDYKYVPAASSSSIPSNKLSDDELCKLGVHELVKRLRKVEGDNMKLMSDHGGMMKEVNRRMQIHLMEIRTLKEVNQKLQDDSQELRDLCCFLDDDRQKGRKLAREWQRFGRYTASVMRQEVSVYQGKLRDLDGKQQDLMKDNLELKELCLYLDEERVTNRVGAACSQCGALSAPQGLRDEGDGSSSSTNNDEPLILNPYTANIANSLKERLFADYLPRQKSNVNEQILNYIKSLEKRVQQLEDEKQTMKFPRNNDGTKPPYPPPYRRPPKPPSESERNQQVDRGNNNHNRKPEAVIHAMKVLELHEQLEKEASASNDADDLGNREKALVKEMCNVVWRTLEDVPPQLQQEI